MALTRLTLIRLPTVATFSRNAGEGKVVYGRLSSQVTVASMTMKMMKGVAIAEMAMI